ncbi:J domain-containing protein [Reinekea sp. G2M2-21]|uniref:J domain-containing protein n=1 Tax=Reinekea sp. G2M2-21 TaxID=2788942 RepID=UPI0018AAAC51|nr:J domain-containing protein [Reinekea sp. G2M2-21]
MELTIHEARNVLSVTIDSTLADIKKAFRRASSLHHPDKGGNTQAMQTVTAAYELLSNAATKQAEHLERATDRAEHAKAWRELADQIRTDLEARFDIGAFTEYFSTVFGEPISLQTSEAKPHAEELEKMAMRDRSPHYATVSAEWSNKDRSKVLELSISVYLVDAHKTVEQLAGDGITYPMGVSTFFYKDGRKVKITKRDYDRTQKSDVLSKPETVFPKSKLVKHRKTTFKRADMDAALTAELGAQKSSNGNYYLPLAGGKLMTIYRTTMMRQGIWNTHGVWVDSGLVKRADKDYEGQYLSFMENEETLNIFRQVVGKEPQAALDYIRAEYDKLLAEINSK